MSITVMKQALEALRHLKHNAYKSGAEMGIALDVAEDAITALRTAIEAAEKQEPVATYTCGVCGVSMRMEAALPAAPVPSSWVETVAGNLVREGINKHKARELAAHFYGLAQQPAAQRQWVDLTDDEIDDADCVELEYIGSGDYVVNGESVYKFAIAIGARLKEKNT